MLPAIHVEAAVFLRKQYGEAAASDSRRKQFDADAEKLNCRVTDKLAIISAFPG